MLKKKLIETGIKATKGNVPRVPTLSAIPISQDLIKTLHNPETDDLVRFLISPNYADMADPGLIAAEIPKVSKIVGASGSYLPRRRKLEDGEALALGAFPSRDGATVFIAPATRNCGIVSRITPPSLTYQTLLFLHKKVADRKGNRQSINDLSFTIDLQEFYFYCYGEHLEPQTDTVEETERLKQKQKDFRKEILDALQYLMFVTVIKNKGDICFHPIGGFSQKDLTLSISDEYSRLLALRTYENPSIYRYNKSATTLLGVVLQDNFWQKTKVTKIAGIEWVHKSVRQILTETRTLPRLDFLVSELEAPEEKKRQFRTYAERPLLSPLEELSNGGDFRYFFSYSGKAAPIKGGARNHPLKKLLEFDLYFFPLRVSKSDIQIKERLNCYRLSK